MPRLIGEEGMILELGLLLLLLLLMSDMISRTLINKVEIIIPDKNHDKNAEKKFRFSR
jgi:hypothetical protein